MSGTPNDTHWQAGQFVIRQRQIPFHQSLVANLSAGLGVAAAVTRVENFVTKILIILIAAR